MNRKDLLARARELSGPITEDRRYLHAHAETGFDLRGTCAYVEQRLQQIGVTARKCGRCGLVADIGSGKAPCILLRADMDALPIREESGESFACTDGRMHACGHDLHTAMLLGAARLLKERENEIAGTIRLMFQPAEEILEGSADMLADGLLDAPAPEMAFMLHVMTGVELPVGTVVVSSPGTSAPAADMFEIRVQGKGCHGAMPHTGVDPIVAGAQIVLALQSLQAREISISQRAVMSIGSFQAGDAPNVIPDEAVIRGSMRAFEDETQAFLLQRTRELAELTAQAHRAQASFRSLSHCPTLQNDPDVSRFARETLVEMLETGQVLESGELSGSASRSSGSEDFASVSHRVPSVMAAIAAGSPAEGYNQPLHHPQVRFDERALPVGAAAYAAMGFAGACRGRTPVA